MQILSKDNHFSGIYMRGTHYRYSEFDEYCVETVRATPVLSRSLALSLSRIRARPRHVKYLTLKISRLLLCSRARRHRANAGYFTISGISRKWQASGWIEKKKEKKFGARTARPRSLPSSFPSNYVTVFVTVVIVASPLSSSSSLPSLIAKRVE